MCAQQHRATKCVSICVDSFQHMIIPKLLALFHFNFPRFFGPTHTMYPLPNLCSIWAPARTRRKVFIWRRLHAYMRESTGTHAQFHWIILPPPPASLVLYQVCSPFTHTPREHHAQRFIIIHSRSVSGHRKSRAQSPSASRDSLLTLFVKNTLDK